MNEDIKKNIESTSMSKLEKESVLNSILSLYNAELVNHILEKNCI